MRAKLIPVNGLVGCVPPDTVQVKVKVQGGFGRVEQKTQLTGLKVIFGNESDPTAIAGICVSTGSVIYLSGEDLSNFQWAKQVYTHEGIRFIMVPCNKIVLIDPDGNDGVVGVAYAEKPQDPPSFLIKEVN